MKVKFFECVVNRTVRSLHEVIIESEKLKDAAKRLNIACKTLRILLLGIIIEDSSGKHIMSFEKIKSRWSTVELAKEELKEKYEQQISQLRIPLHKWTLSEIHEVIIQTNNFAELLKVVSSEHLGFRNYLRGFTYTDESGLVWPLSYDLLKTQWTKAQAEQIMGASYHTTSQSSKEIQYFLTFQKIHIALQKSSDLEMCIDKLGVTFQHLQIYLSRYIIAHPNGTYSALTYSNFQTHFPTYADASRYFGNLYNRDLFPVYYSYGSLPLSTIYEAIINSETESDAAKKLNFAPVKFTRIMSEFYLLKTDQKPKMLSFNLIKSYWPIKDQGKQIWGKYYSKFKNISDIQRPINTDPLPHDNSNDNSNNNNNNNNNLETKRFLNESSIEMNDVTKKFKYSTDDVDVDVDLDVDVNVNVDDFINYDSYIPGFL